MEKLLDFKEASESITEISPDLEDGVVVNAWSLLSFLCEVLSEEPVVGAFDKQAVEFIWTNDLRCFVASTFIRIYFKGQVFPHTLSESKEERLDKTKEVAEQIALFYNRLQK